MYTWQKEEIARGAAIDDTYAIEKKKPKKRLMVNYDLTTDFLAPDEPASTLRAL